MLSFLLSLYWFVWVVPIFRISSCLSLPFVFFFFSSRRRHTRCLSDWSSDVCSSDLKPWLILFLAIAAFYLWGLGSLPLVGPDEPRYAQVAREMLARGDFITPTLGGLQIGRASCRERV